MFSEKAFLLVDFLSGMLFALLDLAPMQDRVNVLFALANAGERLGWLVSFVRLFVSLFHGNAKNPSRTKPLLIKGYSAFAPR